MCCSLGTHQNEQHTDDHAQHEIADEIECLASAFKARPSVQVRIIVPITIGAATRKTSLTPGR